MQLIIRDLIYRSPLKYFLYLFCREPMWIHVPSPPQKIPLWKIPLYLIAIPQGGISTSLHATSADTEAHRRTKRAYDRNAAMEAPVYLLYTTVNLREGDGYTIQILWEGCEGIGYLELLQPL